MLSCYVRYVVLNVLFHGTHFMTLRFLIYVVFIVRAIIHRVTLFPMFHMYVVSYVMICCKCPRRTSIGVFVSGRISQTRAFATLYVFCFKKVTMRFYGFGCSGGETQNIATL